MIAFSVCYVPACQIADHLRGPHHCNVTFEKIKKFRTSIFSRRGQFFPNITDPLSHPGDSGMSVRPTEPPPPSLVTSGCSVVRCKWREVKIFIFRPTGHREKIAVFGASPLLPPPLRVNAIASDNCKKDTDFS